MKATTVYLKYFGKALITILGLGLIFFLLLLIRQILVSKASAAPPPKMRQLALLVAGPHIDAQTSLRAASGHSQPFIGSPEYVKSYVIAAAQSVGVNPERVDWIVGHESQYGQNLVGDHGISLGPWQFNVQANTQISKACAMDLKCSTDLALQWILAGKISKWSTWRFRFTWFPNENPPL